MADAAPVGETSPTFGSAPSRNFFVDLLRGLSIAVVMCLHIAYPKWQDGTVPHRLKLVVASAYYGVTIFFVISGYLIAMTSIKRFRSLPEIDLGRFARFRFGRIVPFLVLVLLSLITLGLAGAQGFVFSKGDSMVDAVTSVLSLQFNDWYVSHRNSQTEAWTVMWSLSIEEMFYVFLPLVCRALRTRTMIVVWLLFSVPFSMYARVHTAGLFGFSACVDALSIGVLTALIAEERRSKDHLLVSLTGMATALLALFYVFQLEPPTSNARWGPLLCALATGVFIYASLHFPASLLGGRPGRRTPGRVLAMVVGLPLILVSRLGRSSYEAYLLHIPILRFVHNYVWPGCAALPMMVGIGVASFLVNTYFTEPVNDLIRRARLREVLEMARWRRLVGPVLVTLFLVAVPNVVVALDRNHPSSVVSVSTRVSRDAIGPSAVPLIVYGEAGDADSISIKKGTDGSVALQFDHWGVAPLVRTIDARLVKTTFTVLLDCATPVVLVEGIPVLGQADLKDFASHDEVSIGKNDGQILSSLITFSNGATSAERHWRRGE